MTQRAHNVWAAKGWPQRYVDAYAFAIQTGRITRSEYMEITGVSPATASRDLAELVEAKVLTAEGKTRTRVYYPMAIEPDLISDPPEEQLPLLVDS
ncbi:MAG: hypothetical protein BZY88_13730 [SAR202 cluster bacterium Io17-Chloro-G9]|nr:MAG: hypothetical protein BZY88_13730 [SAR202 cluster bacterium Io17-Chloro-G9]